MIDKFTTRITGAVLQEAVESHCSCTQFLNLLQISAYANMVQLYSILSNDTSNLLVVMFAFELLNCTVIVHRGTEHYPVSKG